MTLNNRSRLPVTRQSALLIALAGLLAGGPLSAQTVETVNGAEISADVFNMYLESRIQKPAAQATPTERTRFMDELKDIYLLTTQPSAKVVGRDAAKQGNDRAAVARHPRAGSCGGLP